jgi:hypothetical protein
MFPSENVSPQEASQGRAECRAKRTIVNAKCHAIYCPPKHPIGYEVPTVKAILLPLLDDSAEEDGGTDVRARELVMKVVG